MIALPAAFGGFHVSEQGIHFRNRQLPIRPHLAMTGHGRQQLILMRLYTVATAILQHIG